MHRVPSPAGRQTRARWRRLHRLGCGRMLRVHQPLPLWLSFLIIILMIVGTEYLGAWLAPVDFIPTEHTSSDPFRTMLVPEDLGAYAEPPADSPFMGTE